MSYSDNIQSQLWDLAAEGRKLLRSGGGTSLGSKWESQVAVFISSLDPHAHEGCQSPARLWAIATSVDYYPEQSQERFASLVGVVEGLLRYQPAPAPPPGSVMVSGGSCPFHRDDVMVDPGLVFVLMPFSPKDESALVYNTIRSTISKLVVENEPMRCERADDLHGTDVMTDVYEGIQKAACVVVDTTGHNPNVFLEFGMALMVGKPVVVITSDGFENIPFDLRRFRHFSYALQGAELRKLQANISNAVCTLTSASIQPGVNFEVEPKPAGRAVTFTV